MAETCELVSAAACAIGASESIDVAIASPVATAATFAIALEVTVFIVNDFSEPMINRGVAQKHIHVHTIPQRAVSTSAPWAS